MFYYIFKIESKLYLYPESGHALAKTEHGTDALLNISFWMNKHLLKE